MSSATKHPLQNAPVSEARAPTSAQGARPENVPGTRIDSEAFREFKQALTFLRDAYPGKALPHISRAAELEKHNPFYQSYLGVALAYAERRWADAESLCDAALKLRRNEPQLYLNLAEVYIAAGRREDAREILHTGLKFARRDYRLNLALSRLQPRGRPVFRFLPRSHFLNRKLGRLRYRVLQYLAAGNSRDAQFAPR